MGRIYSAVASAVQTTAGDILSIEAPATGIIILHSISVSQSTSESDDSTEIDISRWATAGSGGGAVTPSPVQVGHAASGATVRSFDTTDASSTQTRLLSEGISLLAGFQKIWTPSARPVIPPSGRIVVSFTLDISSVTLKVTAEFEEID